MPLRCLLDTNICIYIAKNRPREVLARFRRLQPGDVGMSAVTYGELSYGARKSRFSGEAVEALRELAFMIPVLPLDAQAGSRYGEIRAALEKEGRVIGNNDLWIGAHALSLGVPLVTNNEREFLRIPGLRVQNWVRKSGPSRVQERGSRYVRS